MTRRRHLPGWHTVEVCHLSLPQPDLAPDGLITFSSASSPLVGGQPTPDVPPRPDAASGEPSPRLPDAPSGPDTGAGGGTSSSP